MVERLVRQGDDWQRMKGNAKDLGSDHFRYPTDKLVQFTVSGSVERTRAEEKAGVAGDSVLGIDLVRLDPDDAAKGGLYNIDHYFVMRAGPGRYVQYGPIRNDDHWVSEIPNEYLECDALAPEKP